MIFKEITDQINALLNLLCKLRENEFTNKIAHLGDASIGGHTRHIIELLNCTLTGYETCFINYENRPRNLALETDIELARRQLEEILKNVTKDNKALEIIVEENAHGVVRTVETNFNREILYNTEHIVHHLALIKVALIDMNLPLVDPQFGLAKSTIKYRQDLVESQQN